MAEPKEEKADENEVKGANLDKKTDEQKNALGLDPKLVAARNISLAHKVAKKRMDSQAAALAAAAVEKAATAAAAKEPASFVEFKRGDYGIQKVLSFATKEKVHGAEIEEYLKKRKDIPQQIGKSQLANQQQADIQKNISTGEALRVYDQKKIDQNTKELKILIKAMLKNMDSVKLDNNGETITAEYKNQKYDMTELINNSDMSQIKLNKKHTDRYAKFVSEKKLTIIESNRLQGARGRDDNPNKPKTMLKNLKARYNEGINDYVINYGKNADSRMRKTLRSDANKMKKLHLGEKIALDLYTDNAFQPINQLLRDFTESAKTTHLNDNYDILCISRQIPDLNELKDISKKNNNNPILVKSEKGISLYGYSGNHYEWGMTQLYTENEFNHMKFPAENEAPTTLKAESLNEDLRAAIKESNAHVPVDMKEIMLHTFVNYSTLNKYSKEIDYTMRGDYKMDTELLKEKQQDNFYERGFVSTAMAKSSFITQPKLEQGGTSILSIFSKLRGLNVAPLSDKSYEREFVKAPGRMRNEVLYKKTYELAAMPKNENDNAIRSGILYVEMQDGSLKYCARGPGGVLHGEISHADLQKIFNEKELIDLQDFKPEKLKQHMTEILDYTSRKGHTIGEIYVFKSEQVKQPEKTSLFTKIKSMVASNDMQYTQGRLTNRESLMKYIDQKLDYCKKMRNEHNTDIFTKEENEFNKIKSSLQKMDNSDKQKLKEVIKEIKNVSNKLDEKVKNINVSNAINSQILRK